MSTFIVFCAGASASGKTTFSKMLATELNNKNISTYLISMDNYYKPRNNASELSNFDLPQVFDLELLRKHVQAINKDEAIKIPQFSFKTKDRLPETIDFDPTDTQVVIIEGIHALYDINSYKLPDQHKYTIFVETDSYLTYLTRRIKRDIPPANEGGRNTPEETTRERELKCGVRDAFFEYIAPVKRYAEFQISNNDPIDLEKELISNDPIDLKNALIPVVEEILTKLNIAEHKSEYSVKNLISIFGKPIKRLEIKTEEPAVNLSFK